jgi:HD superfamily phosphohydrolase YqeK
MWAGSFEAPAGIREIISDHLPKVNIKELTLDQATWLHAFIQAGFGNEKLIPFVADRLEGMAKQRVEFSSVQAKDLAQQLAKTVLDFVVPEKQEACLKSIEIVLAKVNEQ